MNQHAIEINGTHNSCFSHKLHGVTDILKPTPENHVFQVLHLYESLGVPVWGMVMDVIAAISWDARVEVVEDPRSSNDDCSSMLESVLDP